MSVVGRVVKHSPTRKWPAVELSATAWAWLNVAVGDRVVVERGHDVDAGEVVEIGVVRLLLCAFDHGDEVRVRRPRGAL